MTEAEILDSVAIQFGVSKWELRHGRKTSESVNARVACAHLLSTRLGWNNSQIGRHLGAKHPTTILHHLRTFQKRCAIDEDFAVRVGVLEAEFPGPVTSAAMSTKDLSVEVRPALLRSLRRQESTLYRALVEVRKQIAILGEASE